MAKSSNYIAHISEDGREQDLIEHLNNTANLSEKYAGEFDSAELGRLCGLLHDCGKYSEMFQRKIHGEFALKVDHSTAGGQLLVKQYKMIGKLLSYCILGHHSGIPNGGSNVDNSDEPTLCGRLKKQVSDYSGIKELNFPELTKGLSIKPIGYMGITLAFYIKMLYSCLTDADFLDTEYFFKNGQVNRNSYSNLEELNLKLDNYLIKFQNPESEINKKRSELLRSCISKADQDKKMFTLTVPTGGGKTISSMAFAIKHSLRNKMRRIIYVIPYLSIIEQNAAIFKDIFGYENVLEHHSNFDFTNDEDNISNSLKLSTENWDINIIVTTNVQFFESFFSYKSSSCRKLHNVANSVIVLDEAQMLPKSYLKPCLNLLEQLVENYGCSVVLCSATQPSITKYLTSRQTPQEICENVNDLFSFFKRTNIVNTGFMSNEMLAHELYTCKQALCIVGTKKHARQLYQLVKGDGVYHLSTYMNPVSRLRTIKIINEHLKNNQKCIVISTNLLEAGVDLDFPVVYRSVAGLDSLIQSAGRCNREGKREISNVYVFEPENQYLDKLPASLRLPIEITRSIFRNFEDITSLQAVKTYFETLYELTGESLDLYDIIGSYEKGTTDLNFQFREIDDCFKLIEQNTIAIIVPYSSDEDEQKVNSLINSLNECKFNRDILRSLQIYSVNVYEYEFIALFNAGAIRCIKDGINVLCNKDYYDINTGLKIDVKSGEAVFG